MKKLAVALALTVAALTACSAEGDPVACKQAMTRQFEEAVAAGEAAEEGSRPDECDGIDSATIQRFAGEILTDSLEESFS